jgi:hypothetical protein
LGRLSAFSGSARIAEMRSAGLRAAGTTGWSGCWGSRAGERPPRSPSRRRDRRGCSRPRRRSEAASSAACVAPRPGGLAAARRGGGRSTRWLSQKLTRCPARHARIPSAIARCGLPVPGGPEQDDVVFGSEVVELAEVENERLLHRAVEGEVELLECPSGGEPACLIRRRARLSRQPLSQAAPRRGAYITLLGPRPLGQLRRRARRRRCLQRAEEVGDLGARAHAGITGRSG